MSTISIQSPAILRDATGVSGRSMRRTTLRLTVRGRRVLAAAAAAPLAAGIAFSVLAGGSALASGEQGAPVSFETVTVMPGDTLWSIAAAAAPDVDPRDVIDDIMRLNNLSGGTIQAYSSIAIPTEYSH
ncbi:LysM repeat protein [Microbacterium sp. W4I4]|uniref:LysM peptidoglycan-binding domain-containing protein n=1 Tax=Microbacterium sp. W4I4 TaxID=3042295 RepID=UPI002786D84F|nr:LysM peptidoglycan-binding domain-containing protein [Microbacterium sp. W4I4]MDQ0615942.1 LysM repeat protein [Microbacterium sp. W4I4]